MKKIVAAVLTLMMIISLAACGTKEKTEEESANMQNPWVEYSSLDEVNEKVGGKLCAPAAMGVENKYFAVMNDGEMGEYRFSIGGYDYNFRFAPATTEDISGLWVEKGTAFSEENQKNIQKVDDLELVYTDSAKLARWMNIDGQYVLNVADSGEMEEATFLSIAQEMMAQTNMDMVNANSEG